MGGAQSHTDRQTDRHTGIEVRCIIEDNDRFSL